MSQTGEILFCSNLKRVSFAQHLFRINEDDSLYENHIGSLAGLERQTQVLSSSPFEKQAIV